MQFLLSLIGGFLSWAAGNSLMLALLILVPLLYVTLGKAMWTLMFLTDPDRDCELRRAALSPQGVPRIIFALFLLFWPVMLLGPILQGRLLLGRFVPSDSFATSPAFSAPKTSTASPFAAARMPMRT